MGLTLADLMGPAGVILAVLALMSLVSIALIIAKIGALWSVTGGMTGREQAMRAVSSGDLAGAAAAVAKGRAPADRVAAAALQALGDGSDRDAADAAAQRLGEAEMADMRRHLRLLDVIAMTAPLFGLLGTVLGMILSFQALELAGGAANAAVLAGGIWQALLTTAAGLIVAIPAAAAGQLFAARVDRAGQLMEDAVAGVMAAHRRSLPVGATR